MDVWSDDHILTAVRLICGETHLILSRPQKKIVRGGGSWQITEDLNEAFSSPPPLLVSPPPDE